VRSDANWLLSTTVQSTAAFVAIVGGLLVSRLVALTTERSGLRTRREEAERLLDVADVRVAEAEGRLWDIEASRAIYYTSEDIFAAHGVADAEIITQRSEWGVGNPEVVERIEAALSRIRATFSAVTDILGTRDPAKVDPDDIKREIAEDLRRFVEDVHKQLADEAAERDPNPWGLRGFSSLTLPRDAALVAADRQRREREYEGAEEALALARRYRDDRDVEFRLADVALSRLGRPEGIGWGLWTLTYMAATGIVLPLLVMLGRRTDTPFALLVAVVVAFVSGLAAFGLYLRYVIDLARE
jgi:hypothetical protein